MSQKTGKLRAYLNKSSVPGHISNKAKFFLAFPSMPVALSNTLIHNAYIKYYTDMIGRYTPVSSRGEYYNWARDVADFVPDSYVPPPLDFEWEYNDSGSERNRQDKPISGDIIAVRRDDDGYLMNNDIFAAGTTINFIISPTRAVPILTAGTTPDIDTGPIDLQVQVTLDGFKVLQPLEM